MFTTNSLGSSENYLISLLSFWKTEKKIINKYFVLLEGYFISVRSVLVYLYHIYDHLEICGHKL
jgi:hypothetical protein